MEVTAEYGLAALLHDIGKLNINDSVLNAPRPLNAKKLDLMKSYPEEGFCLVRGQGFNRLIADSREMDHVHSI